MVKARIAQWRGVAWITNRETFESGTKMILEKTHDGTGRLTFERFDESENFTIPIEPGVMIDFELVLKRRER